MHTAFCAFLEAVPQQRINYCHMWAAASSITSRTPKKPAACYPNPVCLPVSFMTMRACPAGQAYLASVPVVVPALLAVPAPVPVPGGVMSPCPC